MIYAINHYSYSSQLTISQAANFFHQFVVTLSADEATTQLGIPTATFNTLKGLDDKLTDYVSRTRKSNYTALMQTYDALRKAMFDSVFSTFSTPSRAATPTPRRPPRTRYRTSSRPIPSPSRASTTIL